MKYFVIFYLPSSYLSSACCVLRTVLGPGEAAASKTSTGPALWNLRLWCPLKGGAVGGTENEQTDKREEHFRWHKHWEGKHCKGQAGGTSIGWSEGCSRR